MSACVKLGKLFTARRAFLCASGHAVMVVAQFMQQDMNKLVRAKSAFGEMYKVTFIAPFDRDFQSIKDIAMSQQITFIRNKLTKISRLSADSN